MTPVLVTGGSGYVATRLVADLLRTGHEVRTTVRSLSGEDELRAAVRRGGADDVGLQVVLADLESEDGWDAALTGVQDVHHVASRRPAHRPRRADRAGPRRHATGAAGSRCRECAARRADFVVRGRRLFTQSRARVRRG